MCVLVRWRNVELNYFNKLSFTISIVVLVARMFLLQKYSAPSRLDFVAVTVLYIE